MANSRSALKRVRQNQKRRLRNRFHRVTLRTACKSVEKAILEKNFDLAVERYTHAKKLLDQGVSKGIHHRNVAARKKSRLSRRIEAIRPK